MRLDLLSIPQSVVDSGIESASAACFTFPCLMASGKLPAALWVAVEGNVEGFKNWGGRGYDDFVPGEVTKTAPSEDETT